MRSDFRVIGKNLSEAIAYGRKAEADRMWRDFCIALDSHVTELNRNASGDAATVERVSALESALVPPQIASNSTSLATAPLSGQASTAGGQGEFDPDSGYNLHLGVIASGQAVVPTASVYVANGVVSLADGTSAKPCVGICVRAGDTPGTVYYRCGGRCYTRVVAQPTVGARMYQSTTAGSLTDVYADGLQDVGQFVGMVPKSDGLSMTAIVDMDYERFGVLTTLTLGVDSGDPWEFVAAGGGLDLKGKGGTWEVPATLQWKRLAADSNALLGIDQTLNEESVFINMPVVSMSPDIAALHISASPGGGSHIIAWDGATQVLRVDIDGVHAPGGDFDTVTADTVIALEVEATTIGASDPIENIYADEAEIGAGFFTDTTTTNLTVGTAITLTDSTDNIIGNLSLPATNYVDVGNPTGDGLTFRANGSVNGLYGLFKEDVHALSGVYGSEGVIVGFGRQDHSHDGSLWIESAGTNGVPTAGSQETKVKTTTSGCFFYNHAASAEEGSVDQRFDFDDEVWCTGLKVGSGTAIDKILSATATLDFGSIAAQTTAELTITVTGCVAGDDVSVTPANGIETGLVWCGYVSASDTVTVRLANVTVAAIDPASRSWRAKCVSF